MFELWQKETKLAVKTKRSTGSRSAATGKKALGLNADAAAKLVLASLDEDKAEDIMDIDIKGRSSVADRVVIATGRSQRHVAALAEHVMERLRAAGLSQIRAEGLPHGDWVLLDAGDVIVHLFRPEVRQFYNIEKIWTPSAPAAPSAA